MSEKYFEQISSVENEKKNELTILEKKQIGEFWPEMILGVSAEQDQIDVSKMNEEEIRRWMYDGLIGETEKLIEEWGIKADAELIEKISVENDLEARAQLQIEYIKKCQQEMIRFFDSVKNESSRWSSWPRNMRESGNVNCVGATLIGISLLDRAGIENYFGSPVGHAVNIVRLSNGNWWYVDLRNGEKSVQKITPEITQIDGCDVLKFENKVIDYRTVIIGKKDSVINSILGNLYAAFHEANDSDISDEDLDKRVAIEYISKFSKQFSEINFKSIRNKFFGKELLLKSSEIMQKEKDRIDKLHGFDQQELDKFIKGLSLEQRKALKSETREKIVYVKNFFFKDDEYVLEVASFNLSHALKILRTSLKKIKESDHDLYVEIVKRLVFKGE